MREWLRPSLWFATLALIFAGYAAIEFPRYHVARFPAATIYVALMLLFVLYLAPGFPVSRAWCAGRVRGTGAVALLAALFLLPYLIYSAATGDFRWWSLIRLFALAAAPFGLFTAVPVRKPARLNWQDALVLIWLFTPVVFGWIGGIWNVPVNLDFMTRVYLVGVGGWSFLIIRGVEESGFEFRFSWVLLRDALVALACFAAIGAPTGLIIHFIAWHSQWRGLASFALDFVTIFLFVAIAEELFFRGLLQNLLETTLHSRHLAQGIASILFGLSHIRHAPAPNWRYVILATLAGWFYGWAYRRHRSLMASATTHALVDTIWRTWLTLRVT